MAKGSSLQLPPIGQVGYVVKDVERAIEYYSKVFGIGPFDTFLFRPDSCLLRGKPASIAHKIALAPMGPVQFELIQPLEGNGIHSEFLETKGEGLQHLGFFVDNCDEWVAYLRREGIEILEEAELTVPGVRHVRGVYSQSPDMCGVPFEFIEITELAPA
jgi:catechol 2,3-dioxygenase-like lactoylglutathione lyase family enzyme